MAVKSESASAPTSVSMCPASARRARAPLTHPATASTTMNRAVTGRTSRRRVETAPRPSATGALTFSGMEPPQSGSASVLFNLGAVLALVLANAFFVAAEFGLVGARLTRLEELGRAGDRKATLAAKAVQSLDRYISATQLGITLASRSEEHTSELQSPCNLVCRLLL